MRRATPLLTLAVLACAAAPARAQTPPEPSLSVHARGIAVHPATTVTRVRFALQGRLTPYVAGQKVVVRLYRGTQKIKVRSLTVQPGGAFRLGIKPRKPGRLTIRASHRATPEQGTAVAGP